MYPQLAASGIPTQGRAQAAMMAETTLTNVSSTNRSRLDFTNVFQTACMIAANRTRSVSCRSMRSSRRCRRRIQQLRKQLTAGAVHGCTVCGAEDAKTQRRKEQKIFTRSSFLYLVLGSTCPRHLVTIVLAFPRLCSYAEGDKRYRSPCVDTGSS